MSESKGYPRSPVLRTVARLAVPLTVLVSLIIFNQGHNLPGGGFIAGVMAAAAGAMHLMAFSVNCRAGRFRWWKLSILGLLVAVMTGAVPFFLGQTYMDHRELHLHLPLIGAFHQPTAAFFDAGVYMIVLGTLMTIFVELGQEGH